ncbi:MAG: ABC transporter ATP-binding protein [Saccharolobus sp.]|uniref:ABC transporter ATP-binding protein n=1 Tax=Saccharolobus sp. TaxID=2100761 RepID=UPI003179B885
MVITGFMVEALGIVKKFGRVTAVDGVDLHVRKNEVFCIIGPSGCGKTTLLRCIAGLERPEKGRILINGSIVFDMENKIFVPPEKRGIGMVFQIFAIWPHMKVFENIAYPLTIKGVPKSEIRQRVKAVLELVGLQGLEERYPHELSGGQQQRVSLARALIMNPKVILFDEPMSNLDAKLAEKLKVDIKVLLKRLGISAIYVTHDQLEALTVADRIAVMNNGKICQVGTPIEIYNKPANQFVAEFVGVSNKVKGKIVRILNEEYIQVTTDIGEIIARKPSTNVKINDYVTVFIRVNDISLHSLESDQQGVNMFKGRIKAKSFTGENIIYIIEVNNTDIRVHTQPTFNVEEGKEILLSFNPSHTLSFIGDEIG